MTPEPLHRESNCVGPSARAAEFVVVARAELEAMVEAVARRVVGEELQRLGARLGKEWGSQGDGAQLAGVARKTIRSWQALGILTRGRRGRVNLAELRKLLAGGGAEGHQLPRLDAARRQRAAEEIRQRLAGEGAER